MWTWEFLLLKIQIFPPWYTSPGYEGTFCSDRTFFQCSDRTCSVPFWQNIFVENSGTLEHFLVFPGTFENNYCEMKCRGYIVIGQKKPKAMKFLDWQFSGKSIIENYEKFKNKNDMVCYTSLFPIICKCSQEQNGNIF